MRQPPIQPPTTDSRPAPTIVMPAPPLRHSGEGRNPEGRRGAWQGFQGVGGQAGLPRAPAPNPSFRPPTIVIPAKAGIQRGGGECGKTTTHSLPVISVPRYEAGTQ